MAATRQKNRLPTLPPLSSNSSRRRGRLSGGLLALSLALTTALLMDGYVAAKGNEGAGPEVPASAVASAARSDSSGSSPASPSSDVAAADSCTASTGRELIVALARPACKVITLTGVVSVYDADFTALGKASSSSKDGGGGGGTVKLDGDGGFARTTPVVLRSADGFGAAAASPSPSAAAEAAAAAASRSSLDDYLGNRTAASAASAVSPSLVAARAALEAGTRLKFHVDVPKGVVVELSDLSLAGISLKDPEIDSTAETAAAAAADRSAAGAGGGSSGGGAMFSIFHIHDGGAVRLTRCDLRAAKGMCTSSREEAKEAAAVAAAAAAAAAAAVAAAAAAAAAAPAASSSSSASGGAAPAPSVSASAPASFVGGRVDGALILAADPSATFRRVEHGDVVINQATINPLALFGHERPVSAAAAAAAAAVPAPAPSTRGRQEQRSPGRKLSSSSSSSAAAAAAPPPSSSPPSSSSSSARLIITDTALWCPETGFIRAGRPSAPGEGRVSVSSRVWTPLELASALGSAGSRTVLCEDDLVLPRASHDRPAALVQDRDIVFRASLGANAGGGDGGVSDGGGRPRRRPIRLLCLHEPGAKECVFPVVTAGPGASVSFEGLSIEAPDPGCPMQPASRCSYRGRDLPNSLCGTLLPAGAVAVSSGGWLVFSDVDLAYDYCTPEFERAVDAVAGAALAAGAGAAADGVTLVRVAGGGGGVGGGGGGGGGGGNSSSSSSTSSSPRIAFSCAHCDFNCSLPGSAERGEQPSAFSMRNTTISCVRPLPATLRKRSGTSVLPAGAGGGGSGLASSALAASASSSTAPPPPPSQASTKLSTAALAATLAAGGAAVVAAALGAALGARTVARRAAAAEAAAEAAGSGSSGSGGGDDDNERIRVSSSSLPSPPRNNAHISTQR